MPTGVLRVGLGIVLMASALALFHKVGIDLPLVILLAVPSAFALGLIAQWLVRRARPLPAGSSPAP